MVSSGKAGLVALVVALAGCGGGGSGGGGGSSGPALALFAGDMGGFGTVDGAETAARFGAPQGIATDSGGNIYVADPFNNTIRKITPTGVVSTIAGSSSMFGNADGTGTAALFNSPAGIATDGSGNVYVADTFNHTIRKITPAGVVSTIAGTAGTAGSADGAGAAAQFNNPQGLAIDTDGNVYIADAFNHAIRKMTPAGVVSTFAGTAGLQGSVDDTGAAARFNVPTGVATDSGGNVYVADSSNNTVRKITPAGEVSTLAGTAGLLGSVDDTGAAARFKNPEGVATDSGGNVYVADTFNHTIRKITPGGVVSTLAGAAGVFDSGADGTGAAARFSFPSGLATDSGGNLYVADSNNSTIRKITPAGVVSTIAGSVSVSGSTDDTGAGARFDSPRGIATDSSGNFYVADRFNSTIRKITSAGVVSTLAGKAGVFASADGTGTAARFNQPYGVAVDGGGNVYVADLLNHTIRKITPAGVVSTIAGTAGAPGSADGTSAAARFNFPIGVATDSGGNIYVADSANSTIRKITPTGVVSTFAGTAGLQGSVDGTGAAARFGFPDGLATDSGGNVYVADSSTVRKITPAGVVSTIAGTAGTRGSADGTGAAALFALPAAVVTDGGGNVYVADVDNSAIRKITPAGVVSTIVGVAGVRGFEPGPLPGAIGFPFGIALSGSSLYVTMFNGVAVVTELP